MDRPGLMRVRTTMSVSRRDLMKGAAALGVSVAAGATSRNASAATVVSMFGWQDYDAGPARRRFPERENDIEVSFTGDRQQR